MMKKFLNWLIPFAIRRERKRQIKKGYTAESDRAKGPFILGKWCAEYFEQKRYIEAMAIREAIVNMRMEGEV